jgi:hypothetical protein
MTKQYGREGGTEVKVRTFLSFFIHITLYRTQLFGGEASAPRISGEGRQRGPGWMTFVIAIKLQVSMQIADKNIMRSRDLQCIVYQHISCPYLQTVNYQLTKVLEMMLPV